MINEKLLRKLESTDPFRVERAKLGNKLDRVEKKLTILKSAYARKIGELAALKNRQNKEE